jgi:hypothetical protein
MKHAVSSGAAVCINLNISLLHFCCRSTVSRLPAPHSYEVCCSCKCLHASLACPRCPLGHFQKSTSSCPGDGKSRFDVALKGDNLCLATAPRFNELCSHFADIYRTQRELPSMSQRQSAGGDRRQLETTNHATHTHTRTHTTENNTTDLCPETWNSARKNSLNNLSCDRLINDRSGAIQ